MVSAAQRFRRNPGSSSGRPRKRPKKAAAPSMSIRYSCGDLRQSTRTAYYLSEGRRTIMSSGDARGGRSGGGHWVRRVRLSLPRQLVPSVWTRHGYSREDLEQVLYHHPPEMIFMLGLLLGPFGIPPTNSAVRVSFASPTEVGYSSKNITNNKIVAHVSACMALPADSCLDTRRVFDVPPLPIHHVEPGVFVDAVRHMPHNVDCIGVTRWKKSYKLCGVDMVPVDRRLGAVYMIRIVPRELYHSSGRAMDSIVTRPMAVEVGGDEYYGLIEESCFVLPSAETALE